MIWYKGCAYSFAYRRNKMYLLKSDNGFDWSPMENVEISDCNEAALYFREDKGVFIARMTYGKTLLGRATKPYYNWDFDTLALEMHCPAILLNSEKIYCAGRIRKSFQTGEAAALFKLDNRIVDTLWQSSFAIDAGYPGAVVQDNQVIISYYSENGIKSDIYLKKFFIRPIYAE